MNGSPETVRYWLTQMASHDDKRAFRNFFDYFYHDAYRVALFHVQDRETAEELTSDVFLKLWDRRNTLAEVQHIRTYLLVSVKNHCLNARRKQVLAVVPLDNEPNTLKLNNPDNPEQVAVWNEMQQAYDRAITALPPRCGLIFQMVREQQLPYRDVAEALNITPKTVEIQMGIALKRLNQLVQAMGVGSSSVGVAFFFSYFF